jgi:hypothetical protein
MTIFIYVCLIHVHVWIGQLALYSWPISIRYGSHCFKINWNHDLGNYVKKTGPKNQINQTVWKQTFIKFGQNNLKGDMIKSFPLSTTFPKWPHKSSKIYHTRTCWGYWMKTYMYCSKKVNIIFGAIALLRN